MSGYPAAQQQRVWSHLAALLIIGCIFACGDDRSPLSPFPPKTPAPTEPFLGGIEVTGPTTVHLGETAQFRATAVYSDGTTRDVTAEAVWNVNPDVLALVAPGQVVGKTNGQSAVSATFSFRSSTVSAVIVVPSGTYRLAGTVRDLGKPVHEATVVVASGPLGQSTVKTADGAFTVYGVAGPTTVTVSKDGYQTTTRDVIVANHQMIDLVITPSRPRADLSGRYTVVFTAAPECGMLPEYARSRQYGATVTQSGGDVEVVLDGGQFLQVDGRTMNRFAGFAGPLSVRFELTRATVDFYYRLTWPDLIEDLAQGRFFAVVGVAEIALPGDRLEAPLTGTIDTRLAGSRPDTQCTSANHRLSFTR